jgi:quinol monooxygenase YgiN
VIVVEAALRVQDPARRDPLVEESAPIQEATRRDEPGCLVYCFAADPVEADLIQVYELWTDDDALQQHFAHPNYTAMRTMLNSAGLASAVSRKHRVDATRPVYEDGVPIAGFD